jgi:flavin-dependent dehydrogenase
VEVHWTDGCEAYVTPTGPAEIGVALLWDGRRASFESLLERFAVLHDRLAGATVTSRDRGAGPFGARSRSVAAGDLALVGDAAGSFDPISGEGLSIAFEQAHALIDAVVADDLGLYRTACRKIRRVPVFATHLLLAIEENRVLRRMVMRALSGSEVLFHRMVELVSGDRELRVGGRGGLLGMGLELARAGVLHRSAG